MIYSAEVLDELPGGPATTNLIDDSGGGYGDGGGGFDWGYSGDYGGDDGSSDWGTSASGWDSPSDDMQVVVIVGQKMTLWEKIEYDTSAMLAEIGETTSKIASAIDSAYTTFQERGYITVGAADALGVQVTVDMSNKDIYIGVTTGEGPIVAAGLTPEGMTQNDFLSGWAGGVVLPTPVGIGPGVAVSGTGTSESFGSIGPVVGTPGVNVSYSINASDAWRNSHQVDKVLNEATDYFNQQNGTGGTNPGQYY